MGTSILKPLLPGQVPIQVRKNLDGSTILSIGEHGVLMSPRQACDIAVAILKSNGVLVDVIEEQARDMGGEPLMANLNVKLDGT